MTYIYAKSQEKWYRDEKPKYKNKAISVSIYSFILFLFVCLYLEVGYAQSQEVCNSHDISLNNQSCKVLDLSNQGLTEFNNNIFDMHSLEALDVRGNNFDSDNFKGMYDRGMDPRLSGLYSSDAGSQSYSQLPQYHSLDEQGNLIWDKEKLKREFAIDQDIAYPYFPELHTIHWSSLYNNEHRRTPIFLFTLPKLRIGQPIRYFRLVNTPFPWVKIYNFEKLKNLLTELEKNEEFINKVGFNGEDFKTLKINAGIIKINENEITSIRGGSEHELQLSKEYSWNLEPDVNDVRRMLTTENQSNLTSVGQSLHERRMDIYSIWLRSIGKHIDEKVIAENESLYDDDLCTNAVDETMKRFCSLIVAGRTIAERRNHRNRIDEVRCQRHLNGWLAVIFPFLIDSALDIYRLWNLVIVDYFVDGIVYSFEYKLGLIPDNPDLDSLIRNTSHFADGMELFPERFISYEEGAPGSLEYFVSFREGYNKSRNAICSDEVYEAFHENGSGIFYDIYNSL